MPIKVAMIGAGSIGFTRRLMKDVLTVSELADTEFAFTDINEFNLDRVARLALRDIQANGVPATITPPPPTAAGRSRGPITCFRLCASAASRRSRPTSIFR